MVTWVFYYYSDCTDVLAQLSDDDLLDIFESKIQIEEKEGVASMVRETR